MNDVISKLRMKNQLQSWP